MPSRRLWPTLELTGREERQVPNSTAATYVLASDDERDLAISKLTDHFQAGRLTIEEFDERAGLALRARTRGELTDLLADLPPDGVPTTDPVVTVGCVCPRLARRTSRIWVAVTVIVVALAVSGAHSQHGLIGLVPTVAVVLFVLHRRESARRRPPAEGERKELD
jgi:hypothetical protein